MNPVIAELQARQTIQGMQRARDQAQAVAKHASLLKSSAKSIDGRELMRGADELLRQLQGMRDGFQKLKANVATLSRALGSRPPQQGGMAPAAKWGNEFRAASKQFLDALKNAEQKLGELYKEASAQMNSPLRYSTDPADALDAILSLTDLADQFVKYLKRKK
jgi:hypothetical protein